MSLASESRKHAKDWFGLADTLPTQRRQAALDIAEAWFRLAMNAEAIESHQPIAATVQ
jgi:hypothetical protein